MASGLFVGGPYAPNTFSVPTFATNDKYFYYCGIDQYGYHLIEVQYPHTRTDMPLAAPVILAFWSDEDVA